jgi:hypothetical protein
VEILEDRLPVSENFGTLLAVSALAGWADSLAQPSRAREWAERRIEPGESASVQANFVGPNGLTVTEKFPVAGARSQTAETTSPRVAAFDSVFASVGNDFDADAEQQPFASTTGSADSGHGSDAGPQSPLVSAGTVLSVPMPAYSGGGPASGQMPAAYSEPSAPISAAPTTADQQLTQAARSAAVAPFAPVSSGTSTAQTPIQRSSGSSIQGTLVSPLASPSSPSGGPLVATAAGDGVVPELEDG